MTKKRDDSGKFVVSDDSFNETFAVRVNADLKQWIKAHGGSDYVRSLIEADKAKREIG